MCKRVRWNGSVFVLREIGEREREREREREEGSDCV